MENIFDLHDVSDLPPGFRQKILKPRKERTSKYHQIFERAGSEPFTITQFRVAVCRALGQELTGPQAWSVLADFRTRRIIEKCGRGTFQKIPATQQKAA